MKIRRQEVRTYEERIPSDLEGFKNWEFTSGPTTGADFKVFAKLFEKFVRRNLPAGAKLESFSPNHYTFSGMIKRGQKFAYFSISDVRHFPGKWITNILVRTAKHAEDWRGGSNGFTDLEHFRENVGRLIE